MTEDDLAVFHFFLIPVFVQIFVVFLADCTPADHWQLPTPGKPPQARTPHAEGEPPPAPETPPDQGNTKQGSWKLRGPLMEGLMWLFQHHGSENRHFPRATLKFTQDIAGNSFTVHIHSTLIKLVSPFSLSILSLSLCASGIVMFSGLIPTNRVPATSIESWLCVECIG